MNQDLHKLWTEDLHRRAAQAQESFERYKAKLDEYAAKARKCRAQAQAAGINSRLMLARASAQKAAAKKLEATVAPIIARPSLPETPEPPLV